MNMPIAEHFKSVQGEGFWVGTPMHFIRLAGCSVGATATRLYKDVSARELPVLDNGAPASLCMTYDQRFFVCDTDFRLKEKIDYKQLLLETTEKHICLTGGEPLIHQRADWWDPFIEAACDLGIMVHFETSGTIPFLSKPFLYSHWVACSPKRGLLPNFLMNVANEVKFLVDSDFDENHIPPVGEDCKVFLSPINYELSIDNANVQRCLDILTRHPDWRLSMQMHKLIGVR